MMTMLRPPSDREVAFALLQVLRDRSQEEVEALVEGVTQSDVSRWTRGAFQRMHARKRRAVLGFLAERGIVEGRVREVAAGYAGRLPAVVREARAPYGPDGRTPSALRADEMMRVLSHEAVRARLGGAAGVVEAARALARDYDEEDRVRVERWVAGLLNGGRG